MYLLPLVLCVKIYTPALYFLNKAVPIKVSKARIVWSFKGKSKLTLDIYLNNLDTNLFIL